MRLAMRHIYSQNKLRGDILWITRNQALILKQVTDQ